MLRKTLFLACVALLVTLSSTSNARAWYAYGYRAGGYGYRGGYGYAGGYRAGGGYAYGGYHYGAYGGYRYGYARRW